jgi:F-type H+-transporting ATPase subunit b
MRRAASIGLVLLAVLYAAPAALAAGAGSNDPVQTTLGTILRWINSAIVIAGIVWVFRKLRSAFRGRTESIAGSIEQAARAKADADRRLREIDEKFARLDAEVAGMRQAAERDAAAEAERIAALAREEADKVERAALAEIEASERAARLELKARVARLAVTRAEALLRSQLTPEAQAAVFRTFVSELTGSVN